MTGKTKGNRNNEIGVPLTLLELSEEDQVAVVEMGMENRGEIDLLTRMVKPDIAIITNVGEAHLENLGSLENIARAKAEIVHGLKENGVLLYNGEQPVLSAALAAEQLPAGVTVESFWQQPGTGSVQLRQDPAGRGRASLLHQPDGGGSLMNVYGAHQVLNALPAIYAAKALGLSKEEILAGLAHIEKTGMRNDVIAVDEDGSWMTPINPTGRARWPRSTPCVTSTCPASVAVAVRTCWTWAISRPACCTMRSARPLGRNPASTGSCTYGERCPAFIGTGRHQRRREGCHPL